MKESTLALNDQLMLAFARAGRKLVAAVPQVVAGLLLIILALVVAKLVERGVRALLEKLGFDSKLNRVRADRTFDRLGFRRTPSQLVARFVYFALLFIFARTGADALGLEALSDTLGSVVAFLPDLAVAILILIVGSGLGQIASRAVSRSASETGIAGGAALGSLIQWLVIFVAAVMALGELRIDTEIVRTVAICGLAAISLAVGLSLGLGTRDITRNVVAGFYAKKLFRVGDELQVGDAGGRVKAITPTQILLEKDGTVYVVSNSALLDEVVRR